MSSFIKVYDLTEEVYTFIRPEAIIRICPIMRGGEYQIKVILDGSYYVTGRLERYRKKEDAEAAMINFLERNQLINI